MLELENKAVLIESEKMLGHKAVEELQAKEDAIKDKLNSEI